MWLTDLRVKYASVTQFDRVPRYERGRHGFKSYRLHSLICATIPTGRGNALKMHQVSIRIRSGVPRDKLLKLFERTLQIGRNGDSSERRQIKYAPLAQLVRAPDFAAWCNSNTA